MIVRNVIWHAFKNALLCDPFTRDLSPEEQERMADSLWQHHADLKVEAMRGEVESGSTYEQLFERLLGNAPKIRRTETVDLLGGGDAFSQERSSRARAAREQE